MVQREPVGALEIAARLGVRPRTVHMWRYRAQAEEVPDPMPRWDYDSVNGSPAWDWVKVLRWAGDTGRIAPGLDAAGEYEALFARPPAKHHPVGRRVGSRHKRNS